jgi:hypothetical protein
MLWIRTHDLSARTLKTVRASDRVATMIGSRMIETKFVTWAGHVEVWGSKKGTGTLGRSDSFRGPSGWGLMVLVVFKIHSVSVWAWTKLAQNIEQCRVAVNTMMNPSLKRRQPCSSAER